MKKKYPPKKNLGERNKQKILPKYIRNTLLKNTIKTYFFIPTFGTKNAHIGTLVLQLQVNR